MERETAGRSPLQRVLLAFVRREIKRFVPAWGVFGVVLWLAFSVRRVAANVDPSTGRGALLGNFLYIEHHGAYDAAYAVHGFVSPSWHVTSPILLVPLLGLVLGYGAVASERQGGQLYTTVSLPCSSRTTILGTFLGRAVVLAVAIAIPLLVGWATMRGRFETVRTGRYLLFVATTVGYGLVWLSVAIAISATVSTRGRAAAIVFVVYVAQLMSIHEYLLSDTALYPAALALDPRHAYSIVAAAPYDVLLARVQVHAVLDVERRTVHTMTQAFSTDAVPTAFTWPVAFVVLCCWIVGPVFYTARRLEDIELAGDT